MATILNTVEAAVAYVKEGIIECNEENHTHFSSWHSGPGTVLSFIDDESATLAKGVSLAEVVQRIDEWLKSEMAFARAMRSGAEFAAWAETVDLTREIFDKITIATQRNQLPAGIEVDADTISVFGNCDWMSWGAEHSAGRDVIIAFSETVGIKIIFVPAWREADAA